VTLAEALIAAAIGMTVTGGVLTLADPAQQTFQAQLELSDMLQRLRAGAEALARDLRMAEAVSPSGAGAITIRFAPGADAAVVTRTYDLRTDAAAGAFQLIRRDDSQVNLPVVDQVAGLAFEYFGEPEPCDAGLLRITRIRVTLRVQAASASLRARLPDQEIRFDVAPRNLRPEVSTCSW
jgi:hypothetical protein